MFQASFVLAIFNDVGGGEMLLVGFVALLLFGKDLPAVTRKFGKVYTEFKRSLNDASNEIRREMDTAARELDSAKDVSREVTKDLHSSFQMDPPKETVVSRGDPSSVPSNGSTYSGSNHGNGSSNGSGHSSTSTPEPNRRIAPSVSPAAALDSMHRDIPVPTKIPPPV